MLERRHIGEISPKPHTLFAPAGKKAVELVFTRDGFGGGFSILYGRNHPTEIMKIEAFSQEIQDFLGEPYDLKQFTNCRRHIRCQDLTPASTLFKSRKALLFNDHCRISAFHGMISQSEFAFCNGDADELWFIKEGKGLLLTMFGSLPFNKK